MFQLLGRLILLLIIISVIRRVIKIGLSFWAGLAKAKTRPSASASAQASAGHMALVQDPVCGTYVAMETSLKRIVHGKVIHFCSPECRDQYSA